jgi:hypothetical protein
MAGTVGPCAKEFRASPEVKSQIVRGFPIVLREESEVVLAIFMVKNTTAPQAEGGRAEQKILASRWLPSEVFTKNNWPLKT